MRRDTKSIEKQQGSALPMVMAFILLILVLYSVSINRTLAERQHVLSYYYENVVLDLAENGVELAKIQIKKGQTNSKNIEVDTFRGLEGGLSYKITRLSDGNYKIESSGRLTKNRVVKYTANVEVTGSMTDGKFAIKQYKEDYKN
jgi:hypothetical protein